MAMPIQTRRNPASPARKIARRPIAVGDRVEIWPIMYVALSYDHRIVDGREAVTFLVRIKECVEEPSRILFDV